MDNKLSELSKPVMYVVRTLGGSVASVKSHSYTAPKGFTSEPLYSQEYVSALLVELEAKDERIEELEAQVKVWESAATKHLARAEEAEKRLPILEQDKLRLNEIINSEANRADEAEKLLATPVLLPETYSPDPWMGPDPSGTWLEKEDVKDSIRAAGFKVEGDDA
ncbi:hypothetical protein ACTVOO_02620 [Serratia bockelmannii]|uniref:hypothetical protein n=1 Tax=Serratia bockelmannii TaxID=2703793 RepID=UPI003FA75E20